MVRSFGLDCLRRLAILGFIAVSGQSIQNRLATQLYAKFPDMMTSTASRETINSMAVVEMTSYMGESYTCWICSELMMKFLERYCRVELKYSLYIISLTFQTTWRRWYVICNWLFYFA